MTNPITRAIRSTVVPGVRLAAQIEMKFACFAPYPKLDPGLRRDVERHPWERRVELGKLFRPAIVARTRQAL